MKTTDHITTVMACGIILCLIGLAIRFFVGRRRFNRRNPFGLPRYRSYEGALATTVLERLLNLIGGLMLLLGLSLIAIEWFNKSMAAHHPKKQQTIKSQKRQQ